MIVCSSLEEMLDIAKSTENIGNMVKYNNNTYKLLSIMSLPGNAAEVFEHKCYILNFNTKSPGNLTTWEDANGFKIFFYDS